MIGVFELKYRFGNKSFNGMKIVFSHDRFSDNFEEKRNIIKRIEDFFFQNGGIITKYKSDIPLEIDFKEYRTEVSSAYFITNNELDEVKEILFDKVVLQ